MTVDIPSLAILAQSNGLALEELIKNIEGAINERYAELQEAEPGVQSRMDRTLAWFHSSKLSMALR